MDPNDEQLFLYDPLSNVEQGPYRILVGCLVWLTYSRVDICITINWLSSFSSKPSPQHLQTS
eukprot:c30177_g1_i1 orf=1-183(-)